MGFIYGIKYKIQELCQTRISQRPGLTTSLLNDNNIIKYQFIVIVPIPYNIDIVEYNCIQIHT